MIPHLKIEMWGTRHEWGAGGMGWILCMGHPAPMYEYSECVDESAKPGLPRGGSRRRAIAHIWRWDRQIWGTRWCGWGRYGPPSHQCV